MFKKIVHDIKNWWERVNTPEVDVVQENQLNDKVEESIPVSRYLQPASIVSDPFVLIEKIEGHELYRVVRRIPKKNKRSTDYVSFMDYRNTFVFNIGHSHLFTSFQDAFVAFMERSWEERPDHDKYKFWKIKHDPITGKFSIIDERPESNKKVFPGYLDTTKEYYLKWQAENKLRHLAWQSFLYTYTIQPEIKMY